MLGSLFVCACSIYQPPNIPAPRKSLGTRLTLCQLVHNLYCMVDKHFMGWKFWTHTQPQKALKIYKTYSLYDVVPKLYLSWIELNNAATKASQTFKHKTHTQQLRDNKSSVPWLRSQFI